MTFIAKHDSHDHVKELFQNTWNENVGGSRAVLLYLQEILQLGTQHLDSPRWAIKHASALAIADTVTALGSDVGSANAKLIWPALEKALSGKTWGGKEKVLKACVEFISKAKSFWQGSSEIESKMKVELHDAHRSEIIFADGLHIDYNASRSTSKFPVLSPTCIVVSQRFRRCIRCGQLI